MRHEANCVCIPAADFDNDGDLDLLLVNFYSNAVLYRNETNDKRWLRVKATGTTSNSDGIGARIKVFAVLGDRRNLVGMRQIQSGAGYGRCSPLEAHFGLGIPTADHYQVEILFPGNQIPVVVDSVKAGQRIVVNEDVRSSNNKSSAP